MKRKFIKRVICQLLSITLLTTAIPTIPAKAETSEKYPYTIFAASDKDGAITIDANNVGVNGNIATNGTVISDGYINLNGEKFENINKDMIYISDKLDSTYFNENTSFYSDYTDKNTVINLNKPIEVLDDISLSGNINLKWRI